MFSLQVLTPPVVEPINLAQAKRHLSVDHSEDDAYIQDLVRASRRALEQRYNRAIMTQTVVLRLDGFWQPQAERATYLPASGTWMGQWGNWSSGFANVWTILELPPPLQSLTSVQYLDTAGATQTLSNTNYLVDAFTEPARIYPQLGKTWPATAPLPGAVTITYVAGAATPELVPDDIKHAIRLLVAHYYENREQVSVAIGHLAKAVDLPRGVDELMAPYWRRLVL